jgi:lysyl-tRNA synthetase class 2
VVATVRRFFVGRGYLEVETPIVVPSPGLDLHLDAFAVEGGGYLITSPEYQMKRLLAEGMDRIFQIVRCFRRGELGARHNPEFTMLEWYAAGMTPDEMMTETEALVRQVMGAHGGRALPRFERLTVEAAYAQAGIEREELLAIATHDEDRYFRLLVDVIEPALSRREAPVFLFDFPSSQASLARRKPDDPDFCERFELYVDGIELCNGFGELTDPVEQRARLEEDQRRRRAEGKPVYPIDEKFLAALEQGMPDASGNALGLDRLVALCTGADRIGDVMTFPADQL